MDQRHLLATHKEIEEIAETVLTRLSRRQFITSAAVAGTALMTGTSVAASLAGAGQPVSQYPEQQTTRFSEVEYARLLRSVQAGFGSGFKIIRVIDSTSDIRLEIEHLQNRYIVVSSDRVHWDIATSSIC